MQMATYVGFFSELNKLKTANLAQHALEVGGLGLLAAPTAYKAITGKKVGEKKSRAAELGGLGVLAAHPAFEMGKHLLKKGSADLSLVNSILSLFTKEASDLWEPSTGKVIGDAMGSRAANRGLALAKAAPKPKFTMDTLKNLYKTQGLKPGITSVLKHAAAKTAAPFTLGKGMVGMHALADASKSAVKGMAGVAKPMAKMVANPKRTAMLSHFTPPSQINMSRAISL